MASGNEDWYRLVFLTSPDAINVNRLSDGMYLDVNDRFTRLTGWAREEVIGRTAPEIGIWANAADRQRLTDALAADGVCLNLEAEFRMKDGTVRTGQMSARILDNPSGPCILSVTRDISERKEAEDRIRMLGDRFRAILSSLSGGMLVITQDNRVDFANPAFCRMFDLEEPPEGLVGMPASTMIAKVGPRFHNGTAAVARLREIVAEDKPVIGEEIALADGRVLLRHFLPLVVGSRRSGRVWHHEDLTEQKRAEGLRQRLEHQLQQAQKLESLGVLAGGIAHDFNNLLMAVLGHAELALDDLAPDALARQNLAEISAAARRASDLCRQMLAYSGRATLAIDAVDIGQLVTDILDGLGPTLPGSPSFSLRVEPDLPPVTADRTQVRQAVCNLLLNAAEAIEKNGRVAVLVGSAYYEAQALGGTELAPDLPSGTYVHVEVSDTGAGIPPEVRSRILEPFFSTKFSGRGLGLAAVLGIVRAHQGALTITSEPGRGTTARLLFPASVQATPPDAVRPCESASRRGTVLLADDEDAVRQVAARIFERQGCRVVTAADGREAVDAYAAQPGAIDLVVLDLTMPRLDGAQALAEIRRLDPNARVVLTSGFSERDIAARFAGQPPAGVMQKPYSLAQVRELLARLLPRS
jgi:two-component system, cell cycle sensor histidine kinase and response regulator CckA